VAIHTSEKPIDSFKQYTCKLYFREKIIVSDTVFSKVVTCEDDMEKIAALFLEKILEENPDIENICMAYDISTKEEFRKITDKYFKNKESLKKLNEDQVEAIQEWISVYNA
jgi:putative IMPACT (imprinted ancient) family translation regulator